MLLHLLIVCSRHLLVHTLPTKRHPLLPFQSFLSVPLLVKTFVHCFHLGQKSSASKPKAGPGSKCNGKKNLTDQVKVAVMAVVRVPAGSRGACRQGGVCARRTVGGGGGGSGFGNSMATSQGGCRGVFSKSFTHNKSSPPFGQTLLFFRASQAHGHGQKMTNKMGVTTPEEQEMVQGRRTGQGLQQSASVFHVNVSWTASPDVGSPAGCRLSSDIKMPGSGHHLKQLKSHSSITSSIVLQLVSSSSPPSSLTSYINKSPFSSSRFFSTFNSSLSKSDINTTSSPADPTCFHASSSAIGRIHYSRQPCVSSFTLRNILPTFSSSFSFAMYRRYALGFPASRRMATMADSKTPVEDIIREKVTAAFKPSYLEIHNDSHLHAHHKPMVGSTSRETHFRIHITSEAFKSKMPAARHRMIYALLTDEMARENGIHALSLLTMTPEEEAKRKANAESQRTGGAVACNGSNHE